MITIIRFCISRMDNFQGCCLRKLLRSPGKFSRGQPGGLGGEGWQRWREGDGVKCGNSLEDSGGRDFPQDTNINQNLIFEIKHSTKWSGHYWEWILFTVKQIQKSVYPCKCCSYFCKKKNIAAFAFEFCDSLLTKQSTLYKSWMQWKQIKFEEAFLGFEFGL